MEAENRLYLGSFLVGSTAPEAVSYRFEELPKAIRMLNTIFGWSPAQYWRRTVGGHWRD